MLPKGEEELSWVVEEADENSVCGGGDFSFSPPNPPVVSFVSEVGCTC